MGLTSVCPDWTEQFCEINIFLRDFIAGSTEVVRGGRVIESSLKSEFDPIFALKSDLIPSLSLFCGQTNNIPPHPPKKPTFLI
jgi:hypothetical protein